MGEEDAVGRGSSYGRGLSQQQPRWSSGYWESGGGGGFHAQGPIVARSGGGMAANRATVNGGACGGKGRQQVVGGENVHLTCLNLGKRHYFEDGGDSSSSAVGGRRGRGRGECYQEVPSASNSSSSSQLPVPRCQVDGCHVALKEAKEYHRRHKVCEVHSKAPKVVVLGAEQRFCQQCSRFHAVSEFDDTKRSCRRRLAGHNERRRKNAGDYVRRPPQENSVLDGRLASMNSKMMGRALSLLSSKCSWFPSADLSSRSSAALQELIAENRAKALAKQLFSDGENLTYLNSNDAMVVAAEQESLSHPQHHHLVPDRHGWSNDFHESSMHVTLDFMQRQVSSASSSFAVASEGGRTRPKEDEEVCCAIWKSLEDTVV